MLCLFIDSGIEPGVVSLFQEEKVLGSLFFPSRDPSFPFEGIDSLLEKVNYTKEDLDSLAVGIGPGSYTGIRNSVSVCQSLSFAKKLPLISIPSLFRFIPSEDGQYRIGIDARMGGAFCLTVRVSSGVIDPYFSVEKLPLERFPEVENCTFIVDDKLKARLITHFGKEVVLRSSQENLGPLASYVFNKCCTQDYQIGISPPISYLSSQMA